MENLVPLSKKDDYLIERLNQTWQQVSINDNGYAPFPQTIAMDIASICNYRCIICPQTIQDRNTVFMDLELCRKILLDSFNAGATEACFSVFGEPFLNKRLVDYIAIAKHIGYKYIFINTNGYLATLDRVIPLIDAGLDSIKFSINTFTDNYELFHGAGDFKTVYNNLRDLARYKKENNLNIKVLASTVATKYTTSDIEPIQESLDNICDSYIIKNAYNRGGAIGSDSDYIETDVGENPLKFPCPQLYNIITITAEGYLLTCCQDFYNQTAMADLNLCDIQAAWNNKNFVNYRKAHNSRCFTGTLCNNCLNGTHDEVNPSFSNIIQPKLNSKKDSDLLSRIQALQDLSIK